MGKWIDEIKSEIAREIDRVAVGDPFTDLAMQADVKILHVDGERTQMTAMWPDGKAMAVRDTGGFLADATMMRQFIKLASYKLLVWKKDHP